MDIILKNIYEFEAISENDYIEIEKNSDSLIEMCRRNSFQDCSEDNWYAVLDHFFYFL
jgi:hypothetical protein